MSDFRSRNLTILGGAAAISVILAGIAIYQESQATKTQFTPGEFLPGFAAPDAGRPLGHDVRPGACFGVPDLHEDPAPLAGPGQREAAR